MRCQAEITFVGKIVLDLTAITLSVLLSCWIRFEDGIPPAFWQLMVVMLPYVVGIRFLILFTINHYTPAWRFVSLHDAQRIALSTLCSTLLIGFVCSAASIPYSRAVLIIDSLLNILLLLGNRLCFRVYYQSIGRMGVDLFRKQRQPRRRVLIVGTDHAGEQVARSAMTQGWDLVGFVGDNRTLERARIHGKPVLGRLRQLTEILETHAVDEVLVALPLLSGRPLQEIVRLCEASSAHLSIVPEIEQWMGSASPLTHLRDIRLEDLLQRDPVRLDMEQVRTLLHGQRVLVTGAGGSIGSEICRQVARMNPELILMLGRGENSIFEAVQDLRAGYDGEVIPIIASVTNAERMRSIFDLYRPTVVFHAAAHKHVPLMEACPTEAAATNILGSRNVIQLSEEYEVRKFVLISTDKAVNPASVMGASKHMAEMILQSRSKSATTDFVAVRFGNVLGSRGSVIPTMQKQIQRGGPVIVTHPDITRYFMTIPEAVQLVLQAAAMGQNGEIFVLDMGDPMKIMDLARNLIRLSGRMPGKDIEIRVTGLRPGEKLHEELMTHEEGVVSTTNERISVTRAQVGKLSRAELNQILAEMEEAVARSNESAVRDLLHQAIPGYRPHQHTRSLP